MIDRVEQRFQLKPHELVGDTAYGTASLLDWMVEEKAIEPHVPVWDKSQRTDETFSSSDFQWNEAANEYRCPQGHALRSHRRRFKAPHSPITKDNTIIYRASPADCSTCVLKKSRCCPNTPARQDQAQHLRRSQRCRPSHRDDMGIPAVTARAQEGRDALRSPQAHPEARSVAATRTLVVHRMSSYWPRQRRIYDEWRSG